MKERVNSVGLSCPSPAHSPKRPIFRSGPSPTPRNQADNTLSDKSVLHAKSLGPHYISLSRQFKLTM